MGIVKTFQILSLFFVSLILFHCATSSAGIATSNIPVADRKYNVIGPVEGHKIWSTFDIAIVGIPLSEPPIDKVVTTMLAEKEADALINIRYWTDKYIFLFLTVNRLHINAEAIKFEDQLNGQNAKKENKNLIIGFLTILIFSVLGNCMGATLFKPGGRVRAPALYDSATIIRTSEYDILEKESEGESSTFFIFGIIPITNPISIDYALSQAVQKVPGGRSLINIKVWHETHVMFPLGTVSVLKVKGSVIGNKEEAEKERLRLELQKKEFSTDATPSKDEKPNPTLESGGISVGGNKKN